MKLHVHRRVHLSDICRRNDVVTNACLKVIHSYAQYIVAVSNSIRNFAFKQGEEASLEYSTWKDTIKLNVEPPTTSVFDHILRTMPFSSFVIYFCCLLDIYQP